MLLSLEWLINEIKIETVGVEIRILTGTGSGLLITSMISLALYVPPNIVSIHNVTISTLIIIISIFLLHFVNSHIFSL